MNLGTATNGKLRFDLDTDTGFWDSATGYGPVVDNMSTVGGYGTFSHAPGGDDVRTEVLTINFKEGRF